MNKELDSVSVLNETGEMAGTHIVFDRKGSKYYLDANGLYFNKDNWESYDFGAIAPIVVSEYELAYRLIPSLFKKVNTINYKVSGSYGLKDVVKKHANSLYPLGNSYVSNGAFILAMLSRGFTFDYEDSLNCHFNINSNYIEL